MLLGCDVAMMPQKTFYDCAELPVVCNVEVERVPTLVSDRNLSAWTRANDAIIVLDRTDQNDVYCLLRAARILALKAASTNVCACVTPVVNGQIHLQLHMASNTLSNVWEELPT